jgi:hypothetical protein
MLTSNYPSIYFIFIFLPRSLLFLSLEKDLLCTYVLMWVKPRISEANGRNSSKVTGNLVGLAKTLKMTKLYNILFGSQFCYILKSFKRKTGLQTDVSLGSVLRKKANNFGIDIFIILEIVSQQRPFWKINI